MTRLLTGRASLRTLSRSQVATLATLVATTVQGPSGFEAVRLFPVGADMGRMKHFDRKTRSSRCENRTGPSGLAADFFGRCRQGRLR